jgi:hypothetical protein
MFSDCQRKGFTQATFSDSNNRPFWSVTGRMDKSENPNQMIDSARIYATRRQMTINRFQIEFGILTGAGRSSTCTFQNGMHLA